MEPNKIAESQQTTVDERENWAYPCFAASGHVEIELPSLPGSLRTTETLHARNFGQHVTEAIERAAKGNPYKSGPQQTPAEVLRHYHAVAKGSKLLDEDTLERMRVLVRGFAATQDQTKYHATMVRPFLTSLRPQRRRK